MSTSSTHFYETINIRGRLLMLDQPVVMGILNLTPDSFFEKSRVAGINELCDRAGKMLEEGATILDIGGQSTRPDSALISSEEELNRLIPSLKALSKAFPEAIISVDTFYADVAEIAVLAGASLVNDVSGGSMDPKLFETVARLKVPYVLTHMRGTPQTMKDHNQYNNVVVDVVKELSVKLAELRNLGVIDVIVDPGFGFAKNVEQNFTLLNSLGQLELLKAPILAGLSRKSMIWKSLNTTADQALNGTTALNMVALQNGAKILRVHDVKEAMECIQLFNRLR